MQMTEVHVSDVVGKRKLGMQFSPGQAFRASLPRWGDHACASMPAPPPSTNYAKLAAASLSQADLNDRLGDCVIAKGGHLLGVHTANSNGGNPWLPTPAQILADYAAIGGYNGTPASDRGCNPQAALDYWKAHGFFPSNNPSPVPLSGYGVVDGRNQYLVRQVIHQFEGIDVNLALPDAWVTQGQMAPTGNGFFWDLAGPANFNLGHSVFGVDYTPAGVVIATWGLVGTITWRAWAAYCVPAMRAELYAVVTPALIKADTGRTPAGQPWANVVAFANTLGARIPATPPQPLPPPPPPPQPGAASYVHFDFAARRVIRTTDVKVMPANGPQGIVGTVLKAVIPPAGWGIDVV